MDTGSITDKAVRRALACIRGGRALGGCALLNMAAVRHRLTMEGVAPSAESLEWALTDLLHEIVSERLTDARALCGRGPPATSSDSPRSLLASDFAAGDIEVETWSSLYYRFLCMDLQLGASELARLALPSHRNRSGERLLQRRAQRAIHELAAELRRRELHGLRDSRVASGHESEVSADRQQDAPRVSNDLPASLTSFVGRTSELEALAALLERSDVRLITLVGLGGAGKTRLALEAARIFGHLFCDGVFFVSLAAATSHADVTLALADALEVGPSDVETMDRHLARCLRGRRTLLVLDECEHVVHDAQLLVELMVAAPDLKLVATSRERFGIVAERLVVVEGLPCIVTGDEADPSTAGAIQLFVDRASALRPGFSLDSNTVASVQEICRQVEGMPLALELAASLLATMEPQSIARRLCSGTHHLTTDMRDVPHRHRSMRTVFEESWRSLSPDEQTALCGLAVFRGGFTFASAERVAGTAPGLVGALTAKSLVRRNAAGRLALHRVLQGFAFEKTGLQGHLAQIQMKHAQYFTELAEQAEPRLSGRNLAVWLDRLGAERGNFSTAFEWTRAAERLDLGLRLAGALSRYWELTGRFGEGIAHIEASLAGAQDAECSASLAKALNGAGCLVEEMGDYAAAHAYYERSLERRRATGDQIGVAETLSNLGNVANFRGDYESARALYQESLSVRRQLEDRRGIAVSLNNLGNVATFQGDYERAALLYAESLTLFRAVGDRWAVSVALNNVGRVAVEIGDYARARKALRSSLAIARELDDRQGIAYTLHNLGEVHLAEGRVSSAERFLAESLRESAAIGNCQGVAAALEWLALVARERGDATHAVRLLASADAARRRIGAPVTENERERVDDALEWLRRNVGDAAFELAWQTGHVLTDDEAVEYALRGAAEA